MVFYHHVVTQPGIGDSRAGVDLATVANRRITFNSNVRIDNAILSQAGTGADVRARRIEKGYAGFQHQSANRVAPEQIFKFCEFRPRVDAGNFTSVAMQMDHHFLALLHKDLSDVSQVKLALFVSGHNAIERCQQLRAVEAIDSGAAMAKLERLIELTNA